MSFGFRDIRSFGFVFLRFCICFFFLLLLFLFFFGPVISQRIPMNGQHLFTFVRV